MPTLIRYLLSSLLVIVFLGHVSPVAGVALPQQHTNHQRRHANHARNEYESSKLADIKGLDRLRTYVCPIHSNDIKRQVDSTNGTFTNSAIPMSQVPLLWTELQLVLADLGAVLRAGGYLDPSAVAAALSVITRPLVLTSSVAIPSLTPSPLLLTTAVPTTSSSMTHSSSTLISSTAVRTPSGLTETSENSKAVSDQTSCVETTTTFRKTITVSLIPIDTSVAFNEIGAGSEFTSSSFLTVTIGDVAAFSTTSPSATTSKLVSVVASSSTTTPTITQAGGIFLETSTGSDPTTTQPTAGLSSPSYVFNAASKKNIAVYFGQTPVTGMTNLAAQCADPNIDIAVLAFIITANYQGKYPQVNFGAACGGQTAAMVSDAPGLLSCPGIAADIKTCQDTYGKKVLLSIGGSISQISFDAPAQASDFANVVWDLFGPPGNVDDALRPFGNVTVDGFDIDAEDNAPENWASFATTMRSNFASSPTKKFYLSAAPQCPFPDASIPMPLLLACDFVFVQFYNNPQCEIGSAGFSTSLQQWSSALAVGRSDKDVKPMLYLGAPAFSAAGPTAYAGILKEGGMTEVVKSAVGLELGNFGGVMFWDGPEGRLNEMGGKDIIEWARLGLAAA